MATMSVGTHSTAHFHGNFKSIFKQFMKSFSDHDLMTLAAALAFYTALALAPLLLITLSVVGLLGPSSQEAFLNQINGLMGEQAGSAVTAIVEAANKEPHKSGIAGIIGIMILLFSASGVFAQLQGSLNVIWNATSNASSGVWGWIRKRLLSMGMVITFGFLALVSLLVSTVLAVVYTGDNILWQTVTQVISGVIFAAMFAVIFKYLPDAKLKWKEALTGGVITAVLFAIGKYAIGLYLGKSAIGSSYGAAGSLIVLLAWVYYSAVILFSGAELTRIIAASKGNQDALKGNEPNPNSVMAQGKDEKSQSEFNERGGSESYAARNLDNGIPIFNTAHTNFTKGSTMDTSNFKGNSYQGAEYKGMGADDISIGQVIKEVVDSTKDVIRSEIKLFSTELRAFMPKFKKHSAQVGIFGALLALSVFPFMAFLVIGLGNILDGRYWLSSLIVAVLFAGIGAYATKNAVKKIKDEDFKFNRTKESLNEVVHATQRKLDQIKIAAKGAHYEPNSIA